MESLYLSRIVPNYRNAYKEINDAYEMHRTLCRLFKDPEEKSIGDFLWRLEETKDGENIPNILLQSKCIADWSKINKNWFDEIPTTKNIGEIIKPHLINNKIFKFKLRFNPVSRKGGRTFKVFYEFSQQENFLKKREESCGFQIITMQQINERTIFCNQNTKKLHTTTFTGILKITDSIKFENTIEKGIGHEKYLGMGLLSVVPT
jgi:CRISPR system Cascade subunit CasE